MRILVTGTGGQLGSDVARLLHDTGANYAAMDSSAIDITLKRDIYEAMQRMRPDVIINCAAYTKVDLAEKEQAVSFAVNRDGAANLAHAAAELDALLIHVSTDFVFDGSRPVPYKETDSTAPLGVYGRSKLEGEAEIAKIHARHAIVRTSWLYGAMGGGNFVKTMLRLAAEQDELRVVYDQTGSPTWTADLAGAILDIARAFEGGNARYGIYNYSNEGVASWYDLAVATVEEARALGAQLRYTKITPILTAEYPTPAMRPAYSVLDKAKIKKTFDLSIPHWRTSLRSMLAELYGKQR